MCLNGTNALAYCWKVEITENKIFERQQDHQKFLLKIFLDRKRQREKALNLSTKRNLILLQKRPSLVKTEQDYLMELSAEIK